MAKSTTRDRQREERWRAIMREHARSGMGIRGFCRKSNLRETAFYFWRRELQRRKAEQEQRRPQGNRQAPRAVPAFVSVRVEEPKAVSEPAGRIEIVLSGGRRLHVTAPVDRQALADVLAVLAAASPDGLEGQPC
jgi:transposase-like protein